MLVNRVALVARVTAFLEQRLFTEGTEVKQGDLLYKLEVGPFQADFLAKQAALEQQNALLLNANQTLGRQQALLNTPAGQRSNLDSAVAQQRSQAAQALAAQANLATSKINLDYTQIKAPIAGRITRTNVTEGNVVGPTSGTLASIVSQDPMYVLFAISSRTALDLRQRYAPVGGLAAVKIRVRLPNGKMYAQNGRLDYVDPTISTNTDTLTARAVLPNPLITLGSPAGASTKATERELIDGEFRPGAGGRHHADRGAGRAARGHPVGPAGRLRLYGGCAEPGAADARAARPVHGEHRGGDQRADAGRYGDLRGHPEGASRRGGGARPAKRRASGAGKVSGAPLLPARATYGLIPR